jgi:hypothetical protein
LEEYFNCGFGFCPDDLPGEKRGPYCVDNIFEVYKSNRTLSSVLSNPMFQSIRSRQQDYRGNCTKKTQNLYVPCPIRDHYGFARDVINRHRAKPMDEAAACAIEDKDHCSGMVDTERKRKNC